MTRSEATFLLVISLQVFGLTLAGQAQSSSSSAALRVTPAVVSVVKGQPVQIQIEIQNNESDEIVADLGLDRKSGITMTAVLPDGTQQIGRVPEHGGISRIGKVRLKPGTTYSQSVLANDWIKFEMAGTYRISVQLDRSLSLNGGGSFAADPAVFTVIIEGASEQSLETFCKERVKGLLAATTYSDALSAAEALSYVRAPVCIPYIQQGFGSPYHLDNLFVQDLEGIGTDQAIEALVTVAKQNQTSEPALVYAALRRLSNNTNDPNLREKIQTFLASKP